jgi:hypothetical protein
MSGAAMSDWAKRQANRQIARRMEADHSLYRATWGHRSYAARDGLDLVFLEERTRERLWQPIFRAADRAIECERTAREKIEGSER